MAEAVDNKKNPQDSGNIVNSAVNFAKDGIDSFKDSAQGFMKGIRSRTIPTDGEAPQIGLSSATWSADPNGKDWRVKLSIPPLKAFEDSKILMRLKHITNGLAFPYTPTIIMSHQASYQAITPVHSNYPFYAYQNSSVDQMTLTGQFYVQNAMEGEYWIGALHYLRTITKMFYGQGEFQGAPPPVVKLNGYGDYVFKDVPVVVTNFTLDMPTEIDYIAVNMSRFGEVLTATDFDVETTTSGQIAYVPTESQVTVSLQPIYSRPEVEKFSLDKFVSGGYVGTNNRGFI